MESVSSKASAPVALITGCSSGFGLLAAKELAADGFRVFPTMRDLSKGHQLEGFDVLQLDVTNAESAARAVNGVIEETGRLDVMVNNAGISIGGFFEDLTDGEIREQFETNFFGVLTLTRMVLPIMRKQKSGRIINISSIAGVSAPPLFSGYSASKYALEGFSESLSHEVARFGIQVVLIEPGTFATEMQAANRRTGKRVFGTASDSLNTELNEWRDRIKADPRIVARVIRKAATAKKPKPRYVVGVDAKMIRILRSCLPDTWTSALIRRSLGL